MTAMTQHVDVAKDDILFLIRAKDFKQFKFIVVFLRKM